MPTAEDDVETESVNFTNIANLVLDISSLYLDQKYADVYLIVDGQKIPAHKAILYARSPYFRNIFSQDNQGATNNEIPFEEVTHEAFLRMLKYIYTGSVTVSSNVESTMNVLILAHQHSLEDLKSSLTSHIKSIINMENVEPILALANVYRFREIEAACTVFMQHHPVELLKSGTFGNLSQLHKK